MKPQVKSIDSPDVDDLASWNPGEEFYILLQLSIGLEDDPSADLFHLVVASPLAMARRSLSRNLLLGSGYLVVEEYHWERINETLISSVEKCEGSSWDEIVEKLNKLFIWEYANYTPGD